jgi:diguanylate cyclase (GGDEF)-like protein/PAS domain S-box-containing protein
MNTDLAPAFLATQPQLEVPQFTDSVKTLVWMTAPNGTLTYLSRNVSHLFSEGTVLSFLVYAECIHPDDKESVKAAFAKAITAQEEFQIDYRVIGSVGDVHWVTDSGAPRFSKDGSFQGYTGALLDVTDRYAAIERLEKSEAAHRLLTENCFDLISHHAPDSGVFLSASPSFERILGFKPSEVIGIKSAFDYIHPDDISFVKAELHRQRTMSTNGQSIEFRGKHKGGHDVWLATNVTSMVHPTTGETTGSVAVTRDITSEHAAREDLMKRKARFRSLTSLSSDWFWETDVDDKFSFLSERIKGPTGIPSEEIVGKTRRYLAAHPEEPAFLEYLEKVANHEPFKDIRYQTKGPTPDTVRYASITGEPVYEHGVFKGYRGVGRNVTEEVKTAAKFAQLAEENRALVENSLDLIALLDPQGRFLRINAAAFDILGYQADELLGKPYAELLHPDELQHVQSIDAGLRTGPNTTKDLEKRWIRKDGQVIYMSVSVRWCEHSQLMYATARDVTERYRAQGALQKSKDEQDSMLESIGDAFFAVNSKWQVTYANRRAAAFVGTTPEKGIGRNLLDIAPDLLLSPSLPYYQKAMETREQTFFETYWEPTGVWVEVRVYPGEDGLSVYFHDISAKREAENALRRSEQRFKNLFEQAGDSIIIADSTMRIRDANKRACEELGYTEQELLQMSVSDIDGKVEYPTSMLNDLRAGQSQLFPVNKKRKDGSRFPAEVRISLFEEDGQEFFQAIIRDVTERERAQQKIRESERRFREVIEMTPAGYVFVDGAGQIVDVNPSLCSISGYSREELAKHSLEKLFAHCPWKGVAFTQGGPTAAHGMEAVIRHKTGDDVHVLFNATVKRDTDGNAECLTGLITDITARKRAEKQLELLATHDTLTGLPNRALLNDRMKQMLESGPRNSSITVMFIDLDRFKEVNDSLGHEPGDMLLCEVANRLRKALRPADVIARLGGDEFVVAAHCSSGKASAASIAEKLLSALATPINIGGHAVVISASIGISMFPEDGQTKEMLFQAADTAMYRAKDAGRNDYRFFELEMSMAAKTRMALEISLRPALSRKEFELHYQPRIDLKTMSVVGMEALIRWNHPELGLVPPMQFIPIAEDTGLIDSIGQWVLGEACEQTRRLVDRFGRGLRVSVNLSARQLRRHDIVDQVQAALRRTNLPPHFLELELTESALIEDIEHSAGILKELKNLGITLAVDDFGTGYSGLAYLRRFPIDVLKLDRSFVLQQDEGISSFQFIKAFVDMAHALKLSVVAEGVETGDVLDFLRSALCDEAQGYFLARPLTLEAFEAYLSNLPAGSKN